MIRAHFRKPSKTVARLLYFQAAIGEAHASDDPPISMHMRQRHGLRRLDVHRLSATWSSNGATTAEPRMQIKSARFTEEPLFSSLLNTPLLLATHPCMPSGMLPPRHARVLRGAPSAPPGCLFALRRRSRCASLRHPDHSFDITFQVPVYYLQGSSWKLSGTTLYARSTCERGIPATRLHEPCLTGCLYDNAEAEMGCRAACPIIDDAVYKHDKCYKIIPASAVQQTLCSPSDC
jgi:hypothetical protein